MPLGPQQVRALVFEALKAAAGGAPQLGGSSQVASLVESVATLCLTKSIYPNLAPNSHGGYATDRIPRNEREPLFDSVQMTLWQLLAQGVIVWGLGGRSNDQYPWFRLTDYGRVVVAAGKAQPYDPDGFLREFRKQVPTADPIVTDYLAEAVHAFNASCFRAAAILVGAASEKAILVLLDRFSAKILDAAKKTAFDKTSGGINIHKKYAALKDRLDRMVVAKKFNHDLAETISSQLPGAYELIRKYRNAAGHPDIGGAADSDTVFLTLRVFIEYSRRVTELSDHFNTADADW